MSKKFIQSRLYVKGESQGYNKVEAEIVLGNPNHKESLNGNIFGLIATGADCGDMKWKKYVMECLINQLKEITDSASPNPRMHPSFDLNVSEHDIPMDMLYAIRSLSSTLQYMINCSSWNSNEYYGFDRREIHSKLDQAKY